MSKMFKSLDFLNNNTIKNLAQPQAAGEAARLEEINNLSDELTQVINTAIADEAGNRNSAISTLSASLQADISNIESDYESADAALQASLNTRINELASGFAVREPVYAILVEQVDLEGLTVNTSSYSGILPSGARVLTNSQGGDIDTAHVDNRVWIVSAGAWTPATDLGDGVPIDRALLVSIQQGPDEYNDSVYILVDPIGPYAESAAIGTTALRWAKWQSVDRVLADDVTLVREGTVMSAKLSDDLTTNANGIAVSSDLKALLRDLGNATGNLPIGQVSGLLTYLSAVTLSQFAAATANISLGDHKITDLADPIANTDAVNLQTLNALELPVEQVTGLLSYLGAISLSQLAAATANLSLAGYKLTDLADPDDDTDAVNLQTLNSAIADLQSAIDAGKYAGNLTEKTVIGNDSVFTVAHNFGSRDFSETIYDRDTGETISTNFFRIVTSEDLNTSQVVFENDATISVSKYRILLNKIA